jgi:uncharacterized protein YqjF (DUF2071 family)
VADADDFNTDILDQAAHRPWPLPTGPWFMTQTWSELLFAHWPVDAAVVRPMVPDVLELDLFEGQAWIAVVPFQMSNVAPRFTPVLPGVSAFPELNVRTYVRANGKPGVFFFSLDADSAVAVGGARTLFNLPYFRADMSVSTSGGDVHYRSRRLAKPHAEFVATYRGHGDTHLAVPGTLEHFLTERYCLYGLNHRSIPYRLEIHHLPWPLESASAEIVSNTMTDAAGLRLPDAPPLLHFAKRLDVIAWPPHTLT